MKRVRIQRDVLYESPQVQTLRMESEQLLAASAVLDDMTESWGSWEDDLTSIN